MKTAFTILALLILIGSTGGCSSSSNHRVERHYQEDTVTVETQKPTDRQKRPKRRVVTEEIVSPPEIVIE